jgi:predicted nucleic acid-binding protein
MTADFLVVDASVIVAILSAEPTAERWSRSLSGKILAAPHWARLECAVAISRKTRRGTLPANDAAPILGRLDSWPLLWADVDDSAINRAFALSLSVGHEVADCLYLALAIDMNAPFATADAKLASIAERCAVPVIA